MKIRMKIKENIEYFIKRIKNISEKSKIINKLKIRNKGYLNLSKKKFIKKLNRIKKIQKKLRNSKFFKKLY